ncbi:MAG: branched-chain amino acid ABC transporter permease [Actinomycetota bacterium]|nr:branched-chain amino acid ABC transporter permease [Actinomycetota bacterium]
MTDRVSPRVALLAAIAVLVAAALVPAEIGGRRGYGLGTTAVILVILALGYQVTYGFSGQLSVAVAPLQGVGAFTAARLMADHGWSFWAALPLAILAAAAVGALVGLPGLRVRGDVLALATLGAGEILQQLYANTEWFSGGYQGIVGIPHVSIFGTALDDRGLYVVALAIGAVVLAAVLALRRSPIGRAWLALRDDDVAAKAFGIRTSRVRLLAFAVGAGMAGAAGALYAVQTGFVSSVSFGLRETVTVILVVLVAGEARIGRTVVAAVVATAIIDRLSGYGDVSEAVTGAVILAVVFTRTGLAGAAWTRLRARARLGPPARLEGAP